MLVAAHPDDESSAGGLLAKYASEGKQLSLVYLTRGEGGPCGDPPLCERSDLGRMREQEAREAGQILGVSDFTFLPYIDHGRIDDVLQPIAAPLEELSGALREIFLAQRPEVVLTHGSDGEYGHPQHIQTHRATLLALRSLWPWRPAAVLTFCAAHPEVMVPESVNQNDPADWVIDIAPWREQKLRSFQAHSTQFNVIVAYYRRLGSPFMEEQIETYRHWPEYEREIR